jgi:hypothetical protein
MPDDSHAACILSQCTLHVIPMLNPDGAEAGTRFNAQHIDINRDALRLETSEGQALHRAVETLRPEFGFNLHNQNARAAVGNPPRPAAVSVMAPAMDTADTETAQVRAAKQVALRFVEAVRPKADGMISRYVAEYMPWSFGERVQAMGVITVLVEAGGWPDADSRGRWFRSTSTGSWRRSRQSPMEVIAMLIPRTTTGFRPPTS